MFDIGWSEMLVIGLVALVVVGPKDLPAALKTFAYWMKQARKMAREFQSGVDDLVRQAELDEAKKAVEDARRNLNKEIEKAVDPTGEVKQALSESGVRAPTPSIPVDPPKPALTAALGNGSAAPAAETPAASVPADAGTPAQPAAAKSA